MLKNDYAKVRNLSVFKHGTVPSIKLLGISKHEENILTRN